MTKTIPKKYTSLLQPVLVNVPSGQYFIITGSTDHAGWYPVDESFNYHKALKGWTKWVSKIQEVKSASDWVWSIENSKKNGYYTVTFDKRGWNCSCSGFGFRRKCRHIEEAKVKMN